MQAAWDNHFTAFRNQDLDKIMLDYNERSVVTIFYSTARMTSTSTGSTGIRAMFKKLFQELSDLSDLSAPVIQVNTDPKSVFFCWACPSSGIQTATDTYVFGDDFKIHRQNLSITKKAPECKPEKHFSVFGAQRLQRLLPNFSKTVGDEDVVDCSRQNLQAVVEARDTSTSLCLCWSYPWISSSKDTLVVGVGDDLEVPMQEAYAGAKKRPPHKVRIEG